MKRTIFYCKNPNCNGGQKGFTSRDNHPPMICHYCKSPYWSDSNHVWRIFVTSEEAKKILNLRANGK